MDTQSVKSLVRKVIFPITLNQKYDKQTKQIMKIVLEQSSTFVDVGCHKGEVLVNAIKFAPKGKHFAFEPIPSMYEKLHYKFGSSCEVRNFALSDESKSSSFNHVVSNPAYSGIKQRTYPKKEKINTIEIQLDTLDNQVKNHDRVDLIKIDVEGGELGVLKGAVKTIKKFHPVIVFEHGLGASDYYGTEPLDVFEFFEKQNYRIFTLKGFINNKEPLDLLDFQEMYSTNKEYYFLAKLKVL